MKTIYTIGYGGKTEDSFNQLLTGAGVRVLVDVRAFPRRAHSGSFVIAKIPTKGIQRVLAKVDIEYRWFEQLGNPLLDAPGWEENYMARLTATGATLTAPLKDVPSPFCLFCSEKKPDGCHRRLLADYLQTLHPGLEVVHL